MDHWWWQCAPNIGVQGRSHHGGYKGDAVPRRPIVNFARVCVPLSLFRRPFPSLQREKQQDQQHFIHSERRILALSATPHVIVRPFQSTLRWAVLTVLWIGFCHTGCISLCLSVCILSFCFSYCIYVVLLSAQWDGSNGIEAQSLGPLYLQCFDAVGWVFWPIKPVPDMTYNVFGGTLNVAQFKFQSTVDLSKYLSDTYSQPA